MIQSTSSNVFNAVYQLVIQQGFVVIPSWGTFFCHPVHAQWDKDTHVYLPPHYQLLFNKHIQKSDGALLLALTQQLNCSYFESQQVLTNEIGKWHSQLLQFGKLHFGDLGDFSMQKEQLLFNPSAINFDYPEFFGLNPLSLDISNDESHVVFSYPVTKTTYSLFKTLIILPIILALALLPSKINKYNSSHMQTTSIFKQISLSNLTNNPSSIERTLDTITTVKVALQMPNKTDKTKPTADKNIEKKTSADNTIPEKEIHDKKIQQPITEIKPSASQKQFYVIVGSFTDKNRVQIFNKELSGIHVTGSSLNCNGKIRVTIGGFESHEKAQTALENFKKEHPSYSGWILFW
jgi:hypothetical protein